MAGARRQTPCCSGEKWLEVARVGADSGSRLLAALNRGFSLAISWQLIYQAAHAACLLLLSLWGLPAASVVL